MRKSQVRHIKQLTHRRIDKANAFQDLICEVTSGLSAFLEIIGGSVPFVTFVDDKCALPTPNEDSGDAS